MIKNILLILCGLAFGVLTGLLMPLGLFSTAHITTQQITHSTQSRQHQVIGFLPYWLLSKAQADYSNSITTLSYFALRIDRDGSILKRTTPTEEEPGWHALSSGKADDFLSSAKNHSVTLSLTLDCGDAAAIATLISDPVVHAQNLVADTAPILKEYGFADLNLDIEYTLPASKSAQMQFKTFVKAVRNALPKTTTLTIEISSVDVIMKRLIDVASVMPYVNSVVLMAYDYHVPDSFVTGPIAPLSGAGTQSEYDVETAVKKTLALIPPSQLILGMPLYGYEWETLGAIPRSAVIPGSGVTASSNRVQALLASCATCSAQMDSVAGEPYISYFNVDTDTNHIIFFPSESSTAARINFAKNNYLGGVALWALGYEGPGLLTPLANYKNN